MIARDVGDWDRRVQHIVSTRNLLDLKGIVPAAQFGVGANPLNMTFTTGVGQRYPQHPLHLNSRLTGQPARKASPSWVRWTRPVPTSPATGDGS